ncbi:MAG: 2-succinyl-5-enolpyruvyl-6-hydroxy-3-cyclohexene-1-carboxylic-acid synthase [Nocardioides sp.]
MNPSPEASAGLAGRVIESLLAAGVRDLVLAPGSRNAPLAFAAYDASQGSGLRLHTRIDERTAGFLALGLTRVGSRAAVMCTSGTAVANLHPALLEAAHSGLGLIAVTADRPARLRGTGANQTTDQVGVFGPLVAGADLAAGEPLPRDLLAIAGPVHLNVQFDDPLVPAEPARGWTPARAAAGPADRGVRSAPTVLLPGPRTVVVAGDDAGPPARVLAQDANWPLLAEPTSGSRTGENAIRTYRLLLATELGSGIERIVVAGHPTLSRPVTGLLGRGDVEVISLRARGCWPDRPFGVAGEYDRLSIAQADDQAGDRAWLETWREADRALAHRLDAFLAAQADLTPHAVAGAVSRALPPGGLLFVGASNPIRDLDLMVARYAVGDRRKVIANRGLSGIDGTVSSAIGAALGRSGSGRSGSGRPDGVRNLALMGDVTFVHDANGLVLGPGEAVPDLTIVVVNDNGGSIFATLEQGDPAYADRYDKLFGTPHGVDLAALCAATRTPHWAVESLPELEQALANPNGGVEVIEVKVRRDNRRELDAQIRALVT